MRDTVELLPPMDTDLLLLLLVGMLLLGVASRAISLNKEGKKALGAGRKSLAQGHEQIKKGRKALAMSLPWSIVALILGYAMIKLALSAFRS